MRLKFWEDTITTLFDKTAKSVPDHPIVKELKLTIDNHQLTKRYFERLITARKKPNVNFLTIKDLENYAEESVSSVNYLILEILGVKNIHADHAISHLGKAQGIVNLLRSIYSQAARSQYIPIPQETLMKHGVSQERFYRSKKDDKEVEEIVFEIAGLAHQHLEKVSSFYPGLIN
jgi:NADH dehydrogenase [ubiquinone] 1 alpha subcomplex assembly factor 6